MKKFLFITTIVLLAVQTVFSKPVQEVKSNKVEIFTSVLPQKYFVDKIGGDRVNANVLVGPGKNPATYQPTPKQIMNLSKSDILFTIGVPFEKAYLSKTLTTLKSLRVVDVSTGIQKREISNHSHDSDSDHDSEEDNLDPHVWLSPILAKHISKNILDTLISIDPEGEEFYSLRYQDLIVELTEINTELHNKLDSLKSKTLFVYHPSFGYFLDEFGMYQEAVETGGKEPTPGQLEKIISEAINDNVKIIIVQPEFSIKSATVIANAINGSVTTLNPLEYNYTNNLRNMANIINNAYK